MTTPPNRLGRNSDGRDDPGLNGHRRVLVVDADHRVRDSLAGLIALAEGLRVVATTGQPAEAMGAMRQSRPEIVVLDPRLPELEVGLALIASMRRIRPHVRILVLGWSANHEQLAMDAGADAFICKSADPVAVVEAVLAVALHAGPTGPTAQSAGAQAGIAGS
jgi:DNA-binding NarL/FixJ family response regulator